MTLTDKQFATLWGEALVSHDRDSYISDWSLSSIWGVDPEPSPDLTEIIVAVENIWNVAHMTVKDIRTSTGLTQVLFAQRFCLPTRTLVNWEVAGENHRKCPDYLRLLLAESCGLLRVERKSLK